MHCAFTGTPNPRYAICLTRMQDQWKQHGYRQARFRQKQDNLYRRAASNEMPSMLQNQKGNFLEIVSSNMGVPKAQSKITLPEHVTEQYNFKINSECRDG
jgi:hypothetical protein